MHAAVYLFVAVSAFTGQTLAQGGSNSSLDKRSSTNQLLEYVQHSKRQAETEEGPRNEDTFLPQCEGTCNIYTDMADRCSGITPGASPESMTAVSQTDIMKCACTDEFFASAQACIDCSPQTFMTGDGYDGNMILSLAKQDCARNGISIDADVGSTAKPSTKSSGDAADQLKDGSNATGDDDTGRIANGGDDSDAAAAPAGEDSNSPTASSTGESTGYTVNVQRVLVGTVAATALGVVCFM